MIDSVTYKKGSKTRLIVWGMVAVLVGISIMTFVSLVDHEVSAAVPEGYRFVVVDNYASGGKVRTTYYVYDGKILVEDESRTNDKIDRTVMVYDDVNTQDLKINQEDQMEICELGSCSSQPKILATIKRLLQHRIGRQYIKF